MCLKCPPGGLADPTVRSRLPPVDLSGRPFDLEDVRGLTLQTSCLISKAFGTGIGAQLGWQDIEVKRKDSGEPFVVLHDKGLELLKLRGGTIVHLTLSHTEQHATAMAILEGAS